MGARDQATPTQVRNAAGVNVDSGRARMSRCVRYEHFSASALVALRPLVGWPSGCSRPTDG